MRAFLTGLAILLAAPAAAEKLSLGEISGYFNDMKAVEGRFSQYNDDGSVSTGTLIIHRPGRMRFEYDAPDSGVVIAGGGTLVILDEKSNQPPESYPLRRTPLWMILERRVDLGDATEITNHGFDGSATVVTAVDPKNRADGQISLYFTDGPIALRQWVIEDGNGNSTTMVLDGLAPVTPPGASTFDTGRYTAGRD